MVSSLTIYLLRLCVFVSELNSMSFSLVRNAKRVWTFELGRDQEGPLKTDILPLWHSASRTMEYHQ